MTNSIVNFTRGTQLLGHFGFMFAAGFKLPLIISALVVLGTCWWQVSSALDDYQAYLLWMHLYTSGYMFMEFDPAKLVNLRLPCEGSCRLSDRRRWARPCVSLRQAARLRVHIFCCFLSAGMIRQSIGCNPTWLNFLRNSARSFHEPYTDHWEKMLVM